MQSQVLLHSCKCSQVTCFDPSSSLNFFWTFIWSLPSDAAHPAWRKDHHIYAREYLFLCFVLSFISFTLYHLLQWRESFSCTLKTRPWLFRYSFLLPFRYPFSLPSCYSVIHFYDHEGLIFIFIFYSSVIHFILLLLIFIFLVPLFIFAGCSSSVTPSSSYFDSFISLAWILHPLTLTPPSPYLDATIYSDFFISLPRFLSPYLEDSRTHWFCRAQRGSVKEEST